MGSKEVSSLFKYYHSSRESNPEWVGLAVESQVGLEFSQFMYLFAFVSLLMMVSL